MKLFNVFKRRPSVEQPPAELEVNMDLAERVIQKYGLERRLGAEVTIYAMSHNLNDLARVMTGNGNPETLKGKKALVLNCGSVYAYERATGTMAEDSWIVYPWMCRLLCEVGVDTFGVDAEPQADSETFERLHIDLFQHPERLETVLEGKSFDIICLFPFLYNDDASKDEVGKKMRALLKLSLVLLNDGGVLRYEERYYKKTAGKLRIVKKV